MAPGGGDQRLLIGVQAQDDNGFLIRTSLFVYKSYLPFYTFRLYSRASVQSIGDLPQGPVFRISTLHLV